MFARILCFLTDQVEFEHPNLEDIEPIMSHRTDFSDFEVLEPEI